MTDTPTPCYGRWREFFGDGIGHPAVAERLCAGCPIMDRCLREAMAMERLSPVNMRDGVWGGTTPKLRYQIATQGTGHPDAHKLRHVALYQDPAECDQCTPAAVPVAA